MRSSADAAAMLFWTLLASGQINMRKADHVKALTTKPFDQTIDLAARSALRPPPRPEVQFVGQYAEPSCQPLSSLHVRSYALLAPVGDQSQ